MPGDKVYFKFNSNAMLTTAPRAVTAAAMPNPTSTALSLRAAETGPARSAGEGAEAEAGRATAEPVLVGGRAAGAGAAAVGGRGAAGTPGGEAATPEPAALAGADAAGPPAESVGT